MRKNKSRLDMFRVGSRVSFLYNSTMVEGVVKRCRGFGYLVIEHEGRMLNVDMEKVYLVQEEKDDKLD